MNNKIEEIIRDEEAVWEQRKLGDISSLITKGSTPKDKSGTGEVNFIKVENINDFSGDIVSMSKISLEEHQGYLKRSQLQEGDILFSIAGTLGRVTSVNKAILPANTNQALSIIRLKEGNLEYVKTCLKGNVVADFIRRNPTIGAQPNLSLEQATVDIVVVFDEGEIIQYHLESMNGKINVRLCQVKWKDNSPQANYYDEYEAYEWKYTEKGYLFLEEYHPPGFDGAPGETGFRVQPLDKTCRELNRKYVMPLGYALNNLLITNWDNQNYTELDFYDLYEKMYYMKYGKQVPYEANYGGAEYEVPEDEFEEVIKTYLPFSNTEIEKETFYNSNNKTFRYRPRGLYDCEFPYEPYPEVISYEKLQDGTLKLTIEAVWEIRMLDQAITSELMIKPMEDGSFQYLSNKVISSDQNANAGWYKPRLTEEEWEENYSNN